MDGPSFCYTDGMLATDGLQGKRMTYEEFRELVRQVRHAQKQYFKLRTADWLDKAKILERNLDNELTKQPGERDLFGQ
jgi:hypothetical protein